MGIANMWWKTQLLSMYLIVSPKVGHIGGASNRRLVEGCNSSDNPTKTSFGACSEIPRTEGCTNYTTKSNTIGYKCITGAVIPHPLGLTLNGGGGWLSTNGEFRGFEYPSFYECATATGVSKTWQLQTCPHSHARARSARLLCNTQ